jgi:hypothetical protein
MSLYAMDHEQICAKWILDSTNGATLDNYVKSSVVNG